MDGTIELWDVAAGEMKANLKGHAETVWRVAFSPDGQTLASDSMDGTIKLWDVATAREKAALKGAGPMPFSPDGRTLASASPDGTVKLWDVATAREKTALKGHTYPVTTVAFSPDGQTLASGSLAGTIKLWDVVAGQVKANLEGHAKRVSHLAFSPDGRALASHGGGATIKLWDVTTAREKAALKGAGPMAFSPDGQTLASGDQAGTIKLWDVVSQQERVSLRGHTHGVNSMAFSPDGQMVASGSDDGTIKLWDVATGQQRVSFRGHTDVVRIVAFSPDGQTVASASSRDHTIKLWDVATTARRSMRQLGACGEEMAILKDGGRVACVAFSPDGHTLASGSEHDTVKLWDLISEQVRATLRGRSRLGRTCSVALSSDGRTLASASKPNTTGFWDGRTLDSGVKDDTITLWDVASAQEKAVLRHAGGDNCVMFSPVGRTLAAWSPHSKTIKLWDLAATRRGDVGPSRGYVQAKVAIEKHTLVSGHKVTSAAFSRDGQTLASGHKDYAVRLWDVATGQRKTILTGHEELVHTVAFSPNGKALATRTCRAMKSWDVATGQEKATFKGDDCVLNHAVWSPNCRTFVCAGGHGTRSGWRAGLYDFRTANVMAIFRGHVWSTDAVVFSPDGKQLASWTGDGAIRIWDIRPPAAMSPAEAQRLVGAQLHGFEVAALPQHTYDAGPDFTRTNGSSRQQRGRDRETDNPFLQPQWSEHHAFHWLPKANQGDVEAQYRLALIRETQRNYPAACELHEKVAAASDPAAAKWTVKSRYRLDHLFWLQPWADAYHTIAQHFRKAEYDAGLAALRSCDDLTETQRAQLVRKLVGLVVDLAIAQHDRKTLARAEEFRRRTQHSSGEKHELSTWAIAATAAHREVERNALARAEELCRLAQDLSAQAAEEHESITRILVLTAAHQELDEGRSEGAMQVFREATSLSRQSRERLARDLAARLRAIADGHRKGKRYRDAVELLQRAVELVTRDALTTALLGIALEDMGNHEAAIAMAARLKTLELNDKRAHVHANIGLLHVLTRELDKALLSYEKSFAHGTESDAAELINSLLSMLKKQPDLAEAHYALGFCYEKRGDRFYRKSRDKAKARKHYQAYVNAAKEGKYVESAKERIKALGGEE